MKLSDDLLFSLIHHDKAAAHYLWSSHFTVSMSALLANDLDKYLHLLSLGIPEDATLHIAINYPGSKISIDLKKIL